MEFIGHFFLAIFIGLLVFTAFSAGIVLLVWFMAFAAGVSALILLRGVFRRWLFLYYSRDKRPQPKAAPRRAPSQAPYSKPDIIEAEWQDISDEK